MSEQEYKSKCFSLEEVVAQRSKEIESLRTKLADAQSKLENKSRVNLKLEHQLQNVNANLDIALKENEELKSEVERLKNDKCNKG